MTRPTCEWCGKRFKRPHLMGPVPRYCSQSHRQRAFEYRRVEGRNELVQVVLALADVYDARGSAIWLGSNQAWPHRNGIGTTTTALSMVKAGRSGEVLTRIEQLRSGAFA